MSRKRVFVIMPFKDEFFEVYEMLKIKFEEKFEFTNAGDEGNQQSILKDIIQPIYEADVVIADLTGLNANVMYELGLAHCFNKKTIVITQDDLATLPFDLKMYRAKNYDTYFKKFNDLIEYLEKSLNGAVNDSVMYGNPVKDFLDTKKIDNISWFSNKTSVIKEDELEKGFLDYLADIESNTEQFTENIKGMITDINTMNAGTNASTTEIERVNKSGGSGTAAFVRKESRKVAGYIDTFSSKLRIRNKTTSDLWDEIEKDIFGLLENKYTCNEENKPHLVKYLIALRILGKSIKKNEVSTVEMKHSIENLRGLERSLNQSINFVVGDLDSYLTLIGRITASIDKILDKSKFIVGDISDIADEGIR